MKKLSLAIKFIVSVLIVILLAELSQRMNPQFAGIVVGLPLGTGISIYFITWEQGVNFTLQGIPWGITGLACSLFFCLVYLGVSNLLAKYGTAIQILAASLSATIAFLSLGWVFWQLKLTLGLATFLFAILFMLNLWIVRSLKLSERTEKSNVKNKWSTYVLRALIVGSIILIVTESAPFIGSEWANSLSAFPTTLFALLLVLHLEHGRRLFPGVIHGFSYSITTLLLFYYLYIVFVPRIGLNIGYVCIYALCFIYIFLFQRIIRRFE